MRIHRPTLLVVAVSWIVLVSAPAKAHAACAGYEDLLFCGELTGDCKVKAVDALKALRMAVGQIDSVPEADMNGNGEVTASDAQLVLKIAVGSEVPVYTCDTNHAVLNPVHSGLYFQTGFHSEDNYAVGWYATSQPPMIEIRDYFVFDLSGISRTILGARLHLATAPEGSIVYGSQDPSETYTIFAVATPIDTLTDGDAGISGFDDLADGAVYGLFSATTALGAYADVSFEQAGRDALNAASGEIAVGGAITTLAKGVKNEFLFNATSAELTRQLVLTLE